MNPGLAVIGLIGLAVLLPAPPASAASFRDTDKSPATSVVARAPRAVSVTFNDAVDQDGASMKIFGPDGEVSAAQPQVAGNAVRRPLDKSVPGGKYVVKWKARSTDGDKLSGSFTFVAARGTGTYEDAPARPTEGPAPTGAAVTQATGLPSASPSVSAVPSASASPAAVPLASPSPSPSPASGARGSGDATRSRATRSYTTGGSLSAPLKAVPVALGGLLVLASAAVGLIGTARRHEPSAAAANRRELLVHRGLSLPWQRHQS